METYTIDYKSLRTKKWSWLLFKVPADQVEATLERLRDENKVAVAKFGDQMAREYRAVKTPFENFWSK